MVNNVKKEIELYDKMCGWLQVYLEDKYKRQKLRTAESVQGRYCAGPD